VNLSTSEIDKPLGRMFLMRYSTFVRSQRRSHQPFDPRFTLLLAFVTAMSATFSRLFGLEPTRNISLIAGSSVAVTLAVLTVTRLGLRSTPKKIVPSPRKTVLPKLLAAEQATLPYPPDVFPGARDVDSPVSLKSRGFHPN